MAALGQVWKYVIGGAVGLAVGIGATGLSAASSLPAIGHDRERGSGRNVEIHDSRRLSFGDGGGETLKMNSRDSLPALVR